MQAGRPLAPANFSAAPNQPTSVPTKQTRSHQSHIPTLPAWDRHVRKLGPVISGALISQSAHLTDAIVSPSNRRLDQIELLRARPLAQIRALGWPVGRVLFASPLVGQLGSIIRAARRLAQAAAISQHSYGTRARNPRRRPRDCTTRFGGRRVAVVCRGGKQIPTPRLCLLASRVRAGQSVSRLASPASQPASCYLRHR